MSPHPIRLATEDDLPLLGPIERRAAELFRGVALAYVAELPPLSLSALWSACIDERLFVAERNGVPVGFALLSILDGELHLDELDVDPPHQRRGIGRALLEHAFAVGRARKLPSITLHTFRDVPWNAPFYARCGFVPIAQGAIGPELRATMEIEATRLDPAQRVCMRRPLAALREPDGGGRAVPPSGA